MKATKCPVVFDRKNQDLELCVGSTIYTLPLVKVGISTGRSGRIAVKQLCLCVAHRCRLPASTQSQGPFRQTITSFVGQQKPRGCRELRRLVETNLSFPPSTSPSTRPTMAAPALRRALLALGCQSTEVAPRPRHRSPKTPGATPSRPIRWL